MKELRNNKQQAGFSIMELMVTIVILLIVMSAVFALMRGTIQTANTNYEVTSAEQNLRNSQEYITRDVLTVGDGLFGVPHIWLPTQFVTDYLTVRSDSEIDPTNRGYVGIGSVISDFDIPAGTNVKDANPATTVLPRTDRITMFAVDAEFSAIDLPIGSTNYSNGSITIPPTRIGDFTVGEIYFLTNGATGVYGTITSIDSGANKIFWAEGDDLGLNYFGESGNLATGTREGLDSATLKRINIKHYFVDADGKLIRRAFGIKGRGFIDSVIAEYVVSLKFKYVLQPSATGTIFAQPIEQFDLTQASLLRQLEFRIRTQTASPLEGNIRPEVEAIAQLGVRNIQFLEADVPRDSDGNTDLPNPQPTPVITPTPTPSPSPSPTPILTPTPTPTATPTPTPIPTPTPRGDG